MNKNILNYIKTLSDNDQIQELLIKTIGKILLKQDNLNFFLFKNNEKIYHIRDWINSVIENNEQWKTPRVLTIEALNNAADKYFNKKNNKLQTIELVEKDEKLIIDLGDYCIVQMLTPEALDNESKQMQHCIGHGGYDKNLNDEYYSYLSLRDKYNKAHVTLEIKNNLVKQLQGKQNKLPEQKYLDYLMPWIVKNNYEIDFKKLKLVLNKIDNKVYSKYELPSSCVIGENLSIWDSVIEEFPENITIEGNLEFGMCFDLKRINKGLKINGDFVLCDVEILEISNDIQIGRDLYLYNIGKTKLPDNLKCKNIYIEYEQIDIIKETMDFKKIIFSNKNEKIYLKKDFFKKYGGKKKIFRKILDIIY